MRKFEKKINELNLVKGKLSKALNSNIKDFEMLEQSLVGLHAELREAEAIENNEDEVEKLYVTLKEDSRGMRVIWSKRSREYNKKILTGDIFAIAEVVRDLYRNTNNPNRSYSERVIFEKALQRMVAELAIVTNSTIEDMEAKILDMLGKYHETYQDTFDGEEVFESEEEFEALPQGI